MDRHPAAPTFGRKEQALARATPRNAVASQRHPRLGIRAPGTTRLWETLELKGISGSESPDPVGGSARSLCTRRRPPQEHASPCRVPGSSSDAASETPRPPAARRRSGPPLLLGRLVLTLVSPLSAGGCRQDQREQTGFRRSLPCCHLRARRVATWWKPSR